MSTEPPQPVYLARPTGRWLKIVVPLVAFGVAVVVAELVFRALLFSSVPWMEKFRKPELYGDYFSDDAYWLLYERFGGEYDPPQDPHALLGWISGSFDRDSLLHGNSAQVGRRRPVLFFGDSFTSCAERPCFEDVLNADAAFSRGCFMLNYGVGGYGLDQIYLLMHEVIPKYRDPVVVLGVLTEDVDRAVLSVRVGQKPRFHLIDGELRLDDRPIEGDPERFFAATSPRIVSYLYRLAVYGGPAPPRLRQFLVHESARRAEKVALARALLRQAIRELRALDLDFSVVVFVGNWRGVSSVVEDDDWRLDAILGTLAAEGVDTLSTKGVLREDMAGTGRAVKQYFIPNDGHYRGHTNVLIAGRLRSQLGVCQADR